MNAISRFMNRIADAIFAPVVDPNVYIVEGYRAAYLPERNAMVIIEGARDGEVIPLRDLRLRSMSPLAAQADHTRRYFNL